MLARQAQAGDLRENEEWYWFILLERREGWRPQDQQEEIKFAREARAEEKEAWEEDWDGMRVLRLALLWILLKAQMLSVEAVGKEIPAHQEKGHALVTIPDPCGERDKKNDNNGDEGLP